MAYRYSSFYAFEVSGGVEASLIDRLALAGTAEILSIRFPAGKLRKARAHAPGVVEHLLIGAALFSDPV